MSGTGAMLRGMGPSPGGLQPGGWISVKQGVRDMMFQPHGGGFSAADQALQCEARIFGLYLINRDPSHEMVARYAAANRQLFNEEANVAEQRVLTFVRRQPWSLPFLDAASGLLRPNALLRKKILVMAAILEAAPTFAAEFLPRSTSRLELARELLSCIAGSGLKVLIGALLLPLAERASR